MYAVLPSRIEPGFGYIAQCSPDQCPAPSLGLPDPTQIGLGVSQACPTGWYVPLGHAPQGELSVLLGQGFRPYFCPIGGAGIGAG